MADLQREVWSSVLNKNITQGLEKIKMIAVDESSTFLNAKTVHIPNSGDVGGVVRGDVTLPLPVNERTDTDQTYDLTDFKIKPQYIGWAEKFYTQYDKFADITSNMTDNILRDMAIYFMSQWYYKSASQLVATTGTSTQSNWLVTGGGSLKYLLGANVLSAAQILSGQGVSEQNRYLLLDYVMFHHLLSDLSYNANRLEVQNGLKVTMDPIYGFTVIQMPFVAAVNTSDVIKVPAADGGGFTYATTDRPIGLAVQKDCLSFAVSPIEVMIKEGDPTYYGDIMSAIAWGGAKYRRSDGKGVVAIRATS